MAYYMATITGGDIVVHWDDNNPNTAIAAPIKYGHPIADERVLEVLLRDEGWSIVSHDSDNIGRGFAIVKRTDTRHPFFNPLTRTWQAFLWPEEKVAIGRKFPTARVSGCIRRNQVTTGWT